ncbi:MAG: tRNA uridine-5-carboxymethylaminomethyl(34) synthesis GTPase MnmE [Bacteroidota bacterium]
MNLADRSDTICALATAPGAGAIAVIRLSGASAFTALWDLFLDSKGKPIDLHASKTRTIHFGHLVHQGQLIDEVLVSVFKGPHSYTGEDTVEISCHGSVFIQQQLLSILQRRGLRLARPGEFTMRAFLNGKLDLSQAEAVGDLIAAEHGRAHQAALQQLRGGYTYTIQQLRQQLIDFASLLELELDFAEEDIEFANRDKLMGLVNTLLSEIRTLQAGFASGNVLKNGIPVLIAGKPNVGKSTLLNALLNEEKAIVSDIAGTTRDVIEDHLVIEGLRFRFMDTAGIRYTEDSIERMGVQRTMQYASKASIIVYLCDPEQSNADSLHQEFDQIRQTSGNLEAPLIPVINKSDCHDLSVLHTRYCEFEGVIFLSARNGTQLDELKAKLVSAALLLTGNDSELLVTNARHAESLHKAATALEKVIHGMHHHLSTDLLSFELKDAVRNLGEITGEVYTDDLLGNIFSKFCIGK